MTAAHARRGSAAWSSAATRRFSLPTAVVVLLSSMQLVAIPGSAPLPATAGLRIVFTARDRSTGEQSIWTADGDGTDLTRITPADDGLTYGWSEWALNGTKVVFTARAGPPGSPEHIYLMNPDGSGSIRLTSNPWRSGQPRISPDGRSLLFTSAWDEFERFALYRMDLATLLVTNLSAVRSHAGSLDADAKWTPDGSQIVFASTSDEDGNVAPTQVMLMDSDGSDRRRLTDDRFFSTDPEMSPDGTTVVFASYRGEGESGTSDGVSEFQAKLEDWFLVVHDVATGDERELNDGGPCAARPVDAPCGPTEGPAYIPNWTPDGTTIGYLSILSRTRVCICIVGVDGGGARELIGSDSFEIQWFDFVHPQERPATAVRTIGADAPTSRLLLGGRDRSGAPLLSVAAADRWGELPVAPIIRVLLEPAGARWSPDRSRIAFTAVVEYDPEAIEYGPVPPPGESRRRHFTLDFLAQYFFPPLERAGADQRQTFVMDATGMNVRMVTNAGTEDYLDAIPDGEGRGNIEPDFSPDGRHLLVTNVSAVSRESFILNIDLETGEVVNLTSGTAGAMPASDFQPRFSPDGTEVAFATVDGGTTQIAVVQADDGSDYRVLTDDDYLNVAPAWSPDGRYIVYCSYRGSEPVVDFGDDLSQLSERELASSLRLEDWYLVKLDTVTGRQTVLTLPEDSPAFAPVWSPDGTQIAFISVSGPPAQPDVWIVSADGGPAHPVQVTLRTKETFVDWR